MLLNNKMKCTMLIRKNEGARDRRRSGGQQQLDPGASEAGLVARTTWRRLDPGGEAPNPHLAEAGKAGDDFSARRRRRGIRDERETGTRDGGVSPPRSGVGQCGREAMWTGSGWAVVGGRRTWREEVEAEARES